MHSCECISLLDPSTSTSGTWLTLPLLLLLLLLLRLPPLQATSRNYKAYAQRLSSWGFAVLQYDFMALSPWIDQLCHSDAAEVRLPDVGFFVLGT
jgi:hypothetical protein